MLLLLFVQLASKGKRDAAREAASHAAYLVARATAYHEAADHAAYRAAAAREKLILERLLLVQLPGRSCSC